MRTIKFFFRRRRRGTPSVLAASRARFASKKRWILVGGEHFFSRFSRFSSSFFLLPFRFHISTLLLQPRAHIAEAAAAATTPPAAAAEARE